MPVAHVLVYEARILKSLANLVATDLGIDVPVDLDEVRPAIVVVVDESATPGDVLIVDSNSRGERYIAERAVAVVVIEVARVVGKVRLEDIEPAVAVIVPDSDSHSRLLVPVLAVRASRHHRNIRESAVMIVAEQDAGLGIHRDVNVWPAIVIEVASNRGDGVSGTRFEDASLPRDIGESPVSVVAEEHVGVAGKAARAAHYRDSLPLARRGIARLTGLHRVELDVIADKKVQVPIAIIIEECAARAPTVLFVVDAGLASDIGERAVAVIVEQNVVTPEAAEEIVPSVVVVISDAHAGLPAGARQS